MSYEIRPFFLYFCEDNLSIIIEENCDNLLFICQIFFLKAHFYFSNIQSSIRKNVLRFFTKSRHLFLIFFMKTTLLFYFEHFYIIETENKLHIRIHHKNLLILASCRFYINAFLSTQLGLYSIVRAREHSKPISS